LSDAETSASSHKIGSPIRPPANWWNGRMGHPPSANNGADYARFQAFGTCDRPELEEPADDRFSQYRESARCFLRPPSILFLAQRVVRLGAFINFLIQVRAPAAGELDTYILREGQSPEAVSGNDGKNAY
jgi:hypothetical protein